MRKTVITAILILITAVFSGCSQTGIEQRGIIEGVIIDNTDKGEISYTFSMFDESQDKKDSLKTIKAKNIDDALSSLEKATGKVSFWGQCEYIVLAFNTFDNAYDTLKFFTDNNKIPPDITVAFADKNAVKLLQTEKQQPSLIISEAEKVSLSNNKVRTTLMQLVSDYIDNKRVASVCLFKNESKSLTCSQAVLQKK